MLWATGTSGDGTAAYTEAEATRLFKHLAGGSPTTEGVLFEVDNSLAVTGTASPLAVNTGSAFVNGYFYWNTASVNLTVTTPIVGTTGGRVVLQMITASKTVRLAVIMSTDGISAYPALTQTDGVKWEIPLANFTITTGGVITLVDARGWVHMPTKVSTTMLDDLAVTTAKIAAGAVDSTQIAANAVINTRIRDSAALSVIGRSANSTGDPDDIAASVDGYVLRRSGTTLGFGQIVAAGITDATITEAKLAAAVSGKLVTNGNSHDHSGGDGAQIPTAGIAADAVDDTKAGNRVLQFYRRQGNSATNWNSAGSSNYTPTAVRMQVGRKDASVFGMDPYVEISVTYPVAFSDLPIIFCFVRSTTTEPNVLANVSTFETETASGFTARIYPDNTGGFSTGTVRLHWMAIGPE